MASVLTFVDLVVLGDAIVRRSSVTPEGLVALCEASTDRHAKRALEAAGYVRDGVDSPMETRLRLLIVLAGLPEPKVNFKLYDAYGNLLRRFDLSYPELNLIVEYDGRQHAEDTEQYDTDIYRREDLDRGGWRIVVVTSKGIYQKPEETLFRVHRELKERRAPGLPRRLSDAWRAHFPGYQGFQRSS
jgi:very-short-patch-repair endonuclease